MIKAGFSLIPDGMVTDNAKCGGSSFCRCWKDAQTLVKKNITFIQDNSLKEENSHGKQGILLALTLG